MTARAPARTLTVAGTAYPLVLPNVRDPRLHVAAVLITTQVLGQVVLGFRVSVPQILVAILTCAILEIGLTFRTARAFVWPASAMLTGNGVALILRVAGQRPDDHWTLDAWWLYAGVAGLSLLSKYVIKYRGTHVFNPSNIGLVAAFVVLGSTRVEPLDFWWAPLNVWMIAAYVVITAGGILIDRRLHLLELAAAFWLTLAAGVGLLASSGHCMTTDWSFTPVCGGDFARTIVTSPEVLIFLFFMITDPKTVPGGRVARVVFGILVAIASTLLMAPQTNEFGTKVGLLAGLVLVCALRPLLERLLPAPRSGADSLRAFGEVLVSGGRAHAGLLRVGGRVGMASALVLALSAGIVAAGTPARGIPGPDVTEVLNRVPHQVDPATLPQIAVSQDVGDFDVSLIGDGAQQLVVTLGENLQLEAEALRRRDDSILAAVDHGDRLDEMRGRLQQATASGTATVERYAFASVTMSLLAPFGRQSGLSVGMDSRGTVTEETYDAGGNKVASSTAPFAKMFVIRRATGGRWLNVAVLPPGGG
jgi:hypothetical protein